MQSILDPTLVTALNSININFLVSLSNIVRNTNGFYSLPWKNGIIMVLWDSQKQENYIPKFFDLTWDCYCEGWKVGTHEILRKICQNELSPSLSFSAEHRGPTAQHQRLEQLYMSQRSLWGRMWCLRMHTLLENLDRSPLENERPVKN